MRNDGLIGKIEEQEWLKPTEEGLQELLHKAFRFRGGRQVKNFLHGTWIGHPLHVILTDIPIGAWTSAIAFDALDSMSERRQYSVAADTAVVLGLAGAVGAAAAGLTDWQDIDPPARRIGLVHGLLNVVSVALFGGSLLARRRGGRTTGRGGDYASLWLLGKVRGLAGNSGLGIGGTPSARSSTAIALAMCSHRFRKTTCRIHTCAVGIGFR